MANNEPTPILTTNQISTTDLEAAPVPPNAAPPPASQLPRSPEEAGTEGMPPAAEPAPPGTTPGAEPGAATDVAEDNKQGVGVEGEVVVWEARYSMKNFFGRLALWTALTIAWIALAIYTWGFEHTEVSLGLITTLLGIVLGFMWLSLLYRIILARYGHYYRLTTRRLFISTGLYRRRRDMTELLKVDDVYTRQTLVQRLLGIGTVVVVSSDQKLPVSYLPGVDDPKGVMDTIWHYARAERDQKSVRVDRV